MIRVVLSRVPAGGRFQRFWVPSLDEIERSAATSDSSAAQVTDLIRRVRVGETNKSTAPARLEAADKALLSQLEVRPAAAFEFLDVGCSDGTTSVDTIEKLEAALPGPVRAYLVDRYIWVRRRTRSPLVEYVTSDGQLVMVRCGPLALCQAPPSFLLAPLTNRLVSAYVGLAGFRGSMHDSEPFPLLSPRALSRSNVQAIEASVLVPRPEFAGRMDAVRVANLLHYDYFSRGELVTGLSNVARCVHDGGLLLVSRNHDAGGTEVERGTVWRRAGDSLVRTAEFGGGSELTELVETSGLLR